MSKGKKRVVIVVRMSKFREEETSSKTQLDECRKQAALKGWEIVGEYEDLGRSAYKQGALRPEYAEALKMVTSKQADILLVWKLDRMSRSLVGFMEDWAKIQKAGGEFASVVEQFDTSTTMGKLIMIIIAAFAEMESEMKRDRAIPWNAERAGDGEVPCGPTPFGYTRPEPNKLALEPNESHIVSVIVEAILEGKNIAQVQRLIKDLPSPRPVPLTKTGIKRVASSPTIAGLRKVPNGLKRGCWDAIISKEDHEAVVAILADPHRRTNYVGRERAHMLAGLIRCACGGYARIKAGKGRKRYVCTVCYGGMPTEVAHKAVTKWLMETIDQEAWRNLKEQGRGYDVEIIDGIKRQMAELDEMLDNEELTVERYRMRNAKLNERLAAATGETPLELPDVKNLAKEWEGLSIADQQIILRAVTKSITFTKGSRHTLVDPVERLIIDSAI